MFESVDQFELWCVQTKVSPEAKVILERIRSSEPSRAVSSGKSNVTGRFPSRKMGVMIQFESHKNELPHIRILEDDRDDVIEYYDQPGPIRLSYESAKGKHLGVFHTPDFFVIRSASAGWEECKTEQTLLELEVKSPNRFCRDEKGEWRCPPGERYATQFGFYYKLISSKNINWVFQRNLEFLEDYFRLGASTVESSVRESVLTEVSADFGLSLEELFNRTSGKASRDDVLMLIAHEEIYVDLHSIALPEFKYVRVFPNKEASLAYQNIAYKTSAHLTVTPLYVVLEPKQYINWDGKVWQILNVGDKFVSLLNEDNTLTEIPITVIESLMGEGRITGIKTDALQPLTFALEHPEVRLKLLQASRESLAIANYRANVVRSHLSGVVSSAYKEAKRTVRHWGARYRKAEFSYGCGYIGLIPLPASGNTNERLPTESKELMNEFISDAYETITQRRRREVYSLYFQRCEEKSLEPASYPTFCKAIKARPLKVQKEKRVGRRGAYNEREFYWELELTTPRHGDYPFHIAHIDHTLADVETACAYTGKDMGRPWVSNMLDACTRRILAKYETYDPPSYRTDMMLMRECVRRFKRLPQIVIVDGAFDFSCTYFETLLACFEATKKTRPKAEPRFGSPLERLFGVENSQFFHNLSGNTQIMKNVRQVTKSVNPKNHALWTLESLDTKFTEWAYEVYDTIEHPALGQSPRDAFNQGLQLYGQRTFKRIPYDETFLLLTMPRSKREKAKVSVGGVKINNIRYWADIFNDVRVKGTRVPIRFDPWNVGIVRAFAMGQWVEAHSGYYAVFRNRSEREIMLASEELRRRNKLHSSRFKITIRKLAEFLQSIEAEEFLLHQRLADLAARQIAVKNKLLPSSYIYGVGENPTKNETSSTSVQTQPSDQGSLKSGNTPAFQIYKSI